ncbi:MAG: PIN domain nuclease [Candidatus Omnitrophica bacterium]|nr:PIN domain nuclease [Candidatus Omnitrophota bacterium]
MILVDSSVWIDYFGLRHSKIEGKLEPLLLPYNQTAITGIILQEVLQGIRNERSYELTEELMSKLPCFMPDLETHRLAAQLYRKLASAGKKSTSIDCLIAALALQKNMALFTLDTGFHDIASHSPLDLAQ